MSNHTQIEILESWVNPLYLDVGVQEHIREQFENESQIELQDFLLVKEV